MPSCCGTSCCGWFNCVQNFPSTMQSVFLNPPFVSAEGNGFRIGNVNQEAFFTFKDVDKRLKINYCLAAGSVAIREYTKWWLDPPR